MRSLAEPLEKVPTGIEGLDAATHGGLPLGGVTLVVGEAGAGKTVLALQIVAAAASEGHGGVVISFEEEPDGLRRNASTFSWGPALYGDAVRMLDGRPMATARASGTFQLEGLTAILGSVVEEIGARWVVIDGIDRILALEPDEATAVAEIERLENWSRERDVAVLLTAKRVPPGTAGFGYLQAIEFLLSTSMLLTRKESGQRISRQLRIVKYRGSPHVADDMAMVIGPNGVNVVRARPWTPAEAGHERLSSGVPRLDAILGGGIYRGSTLLFSGAPGTSKTTLAAAFAAAAAERGEKVTFITFDEPASSIVRNLGSVGIDLRPHIDAGTVTLKARYAWEASIEQHTVLIQQMLIDHRPDMLVIDPISAMLKNADDFEAATSLEYVIGLTRAMGITSVMTSLLAGGVGTEATESQISTIADTWVALEYRIVDGERNRALSVVKSRGTAHSNVVRELLLSDTGIDVEDVYRSEGKVLFGTARRDAIERNEAERDMRLRHREQTVRQLEAQIAGAEARQAEARREYERLQIELELERAASERARQEQPEEGST